MCVCVCVCCVCVCVCVCVFVCVCSQEPTDSEKIVRTMINISTDARYGIRLNKMILWFFLQHIPGLKIIIIYRVQ